MSQFYAGRQLGALLIAEGLIPANARLVELQIPADGAVLLRYEVLVSNEDLPRLTRALVKLAEPREVDPIHRLALERELP